MDRRTIIKQISILTGAAFVGGQIFIQSGCKTDGLATKALLSTDQIALLDEIGETIIPQTDSPGAKSTNIGAFMHKMVTDCYSIEEQKIFIEGLENIKQSFETKYSTSFISANADQKTAFLNDVNTQAISYRKAKKYEDQEHYFVMMKQLTILGYFSSEIGATKALNYIAVPGRYDGSYPYKKGDKAWASS